MKETQIIISDPGDEQENSFLFIYI